MNNITYKVQLDVQEPYLSFIRSGKKTVEGRLGKDKYFALVPGDLITINDMVVEIVKVIKYSSFQEMLETEGVENVIPDAKDIDTAVNVYYKFFTKEDEQKYGVAAISIKLK